MGSKKITILLICLSLIIVSMFSGCGGTTKKDNTTTEKTTKVKDPKDYKCTLTSWGWDKTYWNKVTKEFQKKYPNVKFDFTPMANGDSLQKYQTAIAAGTELPDIPWAIIDSRAKLFELDMWEPLNKAPYNFDESLVFDYLKPVMVNSKGDVCGIEQCVNPAGLAYRRDLAKEYFGTDDPAELEKKIPDWKTFIEEGKKVKEKSNGKVFMLPGMGDIQQIISDQDSTPWINGNTVQVTKSLKRSLDLVAQFRDAGIVDKLEAWSPAWYASYGEGKHIFAGCATWSSQFVIQPNDKAGKGAGHWGLMNIPEGNISWGGTTLGISKNCKNKDVAWEFVKFATLSNEGAKAIKDIGFFTSAKDFYKDAANSSYKDEWFGGEDTGKFFIEKIVPKLKLKPMAKDGNVVHDALNLVVTAMNGDKKMTAEEALTKLKNEIKTKLPRMKIE